MRCRHGFQRLMAVLLLGHAAASAWGQTHEPARPTAAPAATRPAQTQPANPAAAPPRDVLARLRAPISVDFQATRLGNVIDFIRHRSEVNVFVNWPELRKLGIDAEAPVTLNLRETPGDVVLRRVLEWVSDAANDNPASFTVEDEIVMISSRRELSTHTRVKVYDVRDLLHAPATGREPREAGLRSAREVGSGASGAARR